MMLRICSPPRWALPLFGSVTPDDLEDRERALRKVWITERGSLDNTSGIAWEMSFRQCVTALRCRATNAEAGRIGRSGAKMGALIRPEGKGV